jgi:hypothetical protein
MGDAMEVDGAAPPHHTHHIIALFQKELGQIRTILTGNSSNQCFWHFASLAAD